MKDRRLPLLFMESCSLAMVFKWEIFFDEVSQFLVAGMRFDGKKHSDWLRDEVT